MKWERTIARHGFTKQEGGVIPDPFMSLAHHAGDRTAEIEFDIHTSTDFSQVRCGVRVRIHCPQTEQHMNLAAELAFRKALEWVNDGASQIGAPLLPPFQEPQ